MKKLSELAKLIDGAVIIGNDVNISSIEHDSRKCESGTLFVCIPGVHVDGHDFIDKAVEKGAAAILTTRDNVKAPDGVSVLKVKNLNSALDTIVPFFHDYPAQKMRIIGITGTNGKTTTSYITRAILRAASQPL